MLKKSIITGSIAILIVTALFFVGCRHRSPEDRVERLTQKIASELDLNENQRKQLDGYKNEFIAKGKEMRSRHDVFKNELIKQLKSDKFDPTEINGMISQHRTDMDAMISLFMTRFSEFHSTLTPEQKEKLVAKLEKFEKRGKGPHGFCQ